MLMQPIPLPKEAAPKSVPIVHLEVEHKPGSKFWPYKELRGADKSLKVLCIVITDV